MRVAVVFDTPYADYSHEDHLVRLEEEVLDWSNTEPEQEYQVASALMKSGHDVLLVGIHDDADYLLSELGMAPVDIVFNVSESFSNNDRLDYLVPALLEAEGYNYTGSPPVGLMLTRNKALSKKILSHHGITVPKFHTYRVGEKVGKIDLEFPAFVKPLAMDASAGISQASVVRDAKALQDRVAFIHDRFAGAAIVEEFIEGREIYIGVLGNGENMQILPATELVFDKDKNKAEERIATKSAKWDDSYRQRKGIKNVLARPIAKAVVEQIAEAVRVSFKALWLRDYARFDIRLCADDSFHILEANANPYLNYGHEMCKAAEKAGMDQADFISKIVACAVARAE